MKSIFTRPLFINPQAYLTIPELVYISKATPFDFTEDSYSFKVNTTGRIEGKLLKAKDDYILHLDLYSIDGNCVLGEFYLNNSELNIDDFNLTQSKNIITLSFGESTSGNIVYPGLIAAWSAKGKTNDDEDRAILKDLTGNGHDITLNGFAFSEMSGYGGYSIYFQNETASLGELDYIKTKSYTYLINKRLTPGNFIIRNISCNTNKVRFNITGVKNNVTKYTFFDGTNTHDIEEDGIYEYIINNHETALCNIRSYGTTGPQNELNLTIEFLPEYPDALVFDGVDDYGVNKDMPILTDYTIIAKRIHLSNGISSFIVKLETNVYAAFNFENIYLQNNVQKFRSRTYATWKPLDNFIDINSISYQTANYYNNIKMVDVVTNDRDSNIIKIGSGNFAFYSAYLFDRSLDEQEIKAFIRKYIDPEYLLPSEIPTPDCYYDFSQGSNDDETRETIKDYSGNGNDAVAHNFAWNEEGSGYKDGALVFDGVDDYVSLDAFDSGFKTMFIVFKTLKGINRFSAMYDQRIALGATYGIVHEPSQIAYKGRCVYKTYINNKENNTLTADNLINKKILVNAKNADKIEETIPRIGKSNEANNFTNMVLYKFLGFKEALTEEQIQYVIKKYNLLDGVDEIEVS